MKAANIITLVRIAMVPVFIVVYMMHTETSEYISLVIFIIASITDKLDGYIARKYNQVSNFGKFVDPLADKLLVASALILLTENGVVPGWATFVILAREFIVTSLRVVAISEGRVLAANNTGKFKTVLQIVAICVLILTSVRSFPLAGGFTTGDLFMWAMTLFTAWSGFSYCWDNRDILTVSAAK